MGYKKCCGMRLPKCLYGVSDWLSEKMLNCNHPPSTLYIGFILIEREINKTIEESPTFKELLGTSADKQWVKEGVVLELARNNDVYHNFDNLVKGVVIKAYAQKYSWLQVIIENNNRRALALHAQQASENNDEENKSASSEKVDIELAGRHGFTYPEAMSMELDCLAS